jgi:hypothetical protein
MGHIPEAYEENFIPVTKLVAGNVILYLGKVHLVLNAGRGVRRRDSGNYLCVTLQLQCEVRYEVQIELGNRFQILPDEVFIEAERTGNWEYRV